MTQNQSWLSKVTDDEPISSGGLTTLQIIESWKLEPVKWRRPAATNKTPRHRMTSKHCGTENYPVRKNNHYWRNRKWSNNHSFPFLHPHIQGTDTSQNTRMHAHLRLQLVPPRRCQPCLWGRYWNGHPGTGRRRFPAWVGPQRRSGRKVPPTRCRPSYCTAPWWWCWCLANPYRTTAKIKHEQK